MRQNFKPTWKLRANALTLLAAVIWQSVAVAATVEEVRLSHAEDHTRLALDLSAEVSYNIFGLDNPDRIVIDIEDSRFSAELSNLDFSRGPIRGIRTGIRDGDDLRLVLDMERQIQHQSFTVAANGELRNRLIIDLYSTGTADATVKTVKTLPVAQPVEKRDILVAVVAGHGGDDPGAPSYNRRFWEKEVTLSIAQAVEQRLKETPGYQPVMIRDGDYSVALKSRPIIARDRRVDVYVSIHADSYRGQEVQGVTVYALSGETADQENIRRVEEKENMADLIGGLAGDTRIADVEDDLALTLLDLSMAWSMEQSVTLGTHILDTLDGVAPLRKNKVQGGNLWELRSPDIPSILIETGYLSNPQEAERLNSTAYQRRLADAIVQGIKNYFYESPPEGTLVAWQKVNGVAPESYVVKRGDSLSVIAERFGVSLAALKTENGLRGDVIQVGRTLVIPGSASPARVAEHRITRGETLSEIAERYRISLASLRRANNLDGDVIRIGQVLKIPTS